MKTENKSAEPTWNDALVAMGRDAVRFWRQGNFEALERCLEVLEAAQKCADADAENH